MNKWELVLYGLLIGHVTTLWWWQAWFDRSGGWIPLVVTLVCYGATFRLATWRFLQELRSLRVLFSTACGELRRGTVAGREALLAKAIEHDKEFSR